MTEERITETTDPAGNTHTTHTVVTDGESRKAGGTNWILILLVLVALARWTMRPARRATRAQRTNGTSGPEITQPTREHDGADSTRGKQTRKAP